VNGTRTGSAAPPTDSYRHTCTLLLAIWICIINKIVLMVQHTYTHTMIKKIKRKYKAMTTEQITDKTYSVQIRRMTDSISSLVSIH